MEGFDRQFGYKGVMRILIYSRAFWPSIGGLEGTMDLLARGFTKAGHDVTVATVTPGEMEGDFNFKVVRQPSLAELWRLARASDVCLSANTSLRGIFPLLFSGAAVVVSHQGWYSGGTNPQILTPFKNGASRLVTNIFASRAVAARIPAPGIVIPNGYDEDFFHHYSDIKQTEDLVFVGRLVSDKGADWLIHALDLLAKQGRRPSLTIIGSGPEEGRLRALVLELNLGTQVRFVGPLRGGLLACEIARHRVMVVPSQWEEPFGIVALEGIACGCVVVGTDGGGLPEAIGPCGLVARRGDIADLATQINRALVDVEGQKAMRMAASDHLSRHTADHIVTAYLGVLAGVARVDRGRGRTACTSS